MNICYINLQFVQNLSKEIYLKAAIDGSIKQDLNIKIGHFCINLRTLNECIENKQQKLEDNYLVKKFFNSELYHSNFIVKEE